VGHCSRGRGTIRTAEDRGDQDSGGMCMKARRRRKTGHTAYVWTRRTTVIVVWLVKLLLPCENPVYFAADRLSTTSPKIAMLLATTAAQYVSLGAVTVLDKVSVRSSIC